MTVRELFLAANDMQYDDIVKITDGFKELYTGTFTDVLKTVYGEYKVESFSQEAMYIEVL